MQEKHLFEYAVIRVVPRVEREEFLNAGVILFCSAQRFLQTKFWLDEHKLRILSAGLDMAEMQERLCAFQLICSGRREGWPIGQQPQASRFRWLTANRSTVIQTSPVHPGLCDQAGETLEKLFSQLVL